MRRSLLSLLAVLFSMVLTNAFEYTVSFDQSNLSIENITKSDSCYSVIHYKGLTNGGEIGHAYLPIQQIRISVPYNATKIKVSATILSSSILNTDYPLLPNSRESSSLIKWDNNEFQPIYNFGVAEIAHIGYAHGAHKIATINIFPIKEGANPGVAEFYHSIRLNLTWTLSNDLSDEPYTYISSPLLLQGVDITKSIVVNPQDVIFNSLSDTQQQSVNGDDMAGTDYLIIAPDEFCDALKGLAQLRRLKGFFTEIYPLSKVLSMYDGDNADPNNIITDSAGKLREFIKKQYLIYGTRNILLAGKYPKMPIRYVRPIFSGDDIPTDLYFGDLNTKWEKIRENVFRARSSCYDFFPEVNIGRIPFENVNEIYAYINKLKTYELNPGNGDATYLANTVITRQDDATINSHFTDEEISNIYDVYNDNVIELLNPIGDSVVKQLNSTPAGCWNFIGHGNPEGVSTYKSSLGEGGLLALDSQLLYLKRDFSKGLDQISNKNFPSWQFSISCALMPFDTYTDTNGNKYNVSKNFGESYILGSDYGGVAMLGNTRPMLCIDGVTCLNNFFPNIKKYYAESNYKFPITAGYMISEMRSYRYDHYFQIGGLMINLFGDPLTPLFIHEPNKLDQYEAYNDDGMYVSKVANLSSDKLFIASMDIQLNRYACLKEVTQSELDGIRIVPNRIHTIYGKDTLPCIMPLYIYGTNLYNNTIFANKLYINSENNFAYVTNPPEILNNGKVVVIPNNTFKIYCLGEVFINNTLQLRENSTFDLYSESWVEIDDIYVPKGAKLIINAKHIHIGDLGISKHPEGTVELINRDCITSEQKMLTRAISDAPKKSLAIKGRTWWYRGFTNATSKTQEWGIKIGDEITIDGETWNKVDMCLYTDVHKIGDIPTYNYEPITIAYIKDDGKTICATRNEDMPWMPAISPYLIYGKEPFYLYTFGQQSDAGVYGRQDDYGFPFVIKEIRETTNSGINYRYFIADVSPNKFGQLFHGENTSTYEYVEGIGHPKYFMLMPYGGGFTEIGGFGFPELTYVTDGDDNKVIYEAAGGSKLWETAGINEVLADPSEGNEQWFNLQGMPIAEPNSPGIYIRRTGLSTEKVAVR